MKTKIYSLGFSYGYHDSAVCFLDDQGQIAFAAQEERFTRKKNDLAFPINSIHAGLKYLKISPEQVQKIGYYEIPLEKISRICLLNEINCYSLLLKRFAQDPCFLEPIKDIRNIFQCTEFTNYYPHHLSHAASSIFLDEYNKGIAVVIDGVGEFDSTSIWSYEKGHINRVGGTHIPDSIGLLYAAITSFLDFRVNDGEYKVMGLAAYGHPEYSTKIRELVTFNDDVEYPFRIDQSYLDLTGSTDLLYRKSLQDYLGIDELRLGGDQTYDDLSKNDFKKYSNLACSIQLVAKEMVHHVFRMAIKKYPNERIYYSGGVALNCSINKDLLKQFGDIRIQPASGDAGGAVGAAFLAHYGFESKNNTSTLFVSECISNSQIEKKAQNEIVYLGNDVSSKNAKQAIDQKNLTNIKTYTSSDRMISEAANDICNGKIIGWVQGRMEWGPRSLGARSILASPVGLKTQNKINKAIKFRELFRPFAPVMLKSFYTKFVSDSELLEPLSANSYMLSIVDVSKNAQQKFPACVHTDKTARIQIIDDKSDLKIACLLRNIEMLGQDPILLNTSFNLKGEPIVSTPEEAIGTFFHSGLDFLYLRNFRLSRESF